jgi:hypothetical protein
VHYCIYDIEENKRYIYKTDNVNKNICIVFFSFLCFTHQMYSLVYQGNYYRTMVLMCLIND